MKLKSTTEKSRSSSARRLAAVALGLGMAVAGTYAAAAGMGNGPNPGHGHGNGHIKPMWLNHFDLLSGDESVVATTHNSTTSGIGTGLTGLVISSSTAGEVDSFGGNKVVHMAVDLPKETKVVGVRLCYEYANPQAASFISQIRLDQLNQASPGTATVVLDDSTDLVAPGPVCVNSQPVKPAIFAMKGPLTLSLRVNTSGNLDDKIIVRGLGLLVE